MDELSTGSRWKTAVNGLNRRSSWSTTVRATSFIFLRARRLRGLCSRQPTRQRLPCSHFFRAYILPGEDSVNRNGASLGQHLAHHDTADIRQPKIASLMAECEPCVTEPQTVQNRGLQIVH